ncbi:MAG: hypothetical protein GY855_13985 [candidate division Zixibacteria bacterium]|nr:hypothetical protein [candidate division Zixibacteria bacterium]
MQEKKYTYKLRKGRFAPLSWGPYFFGFGTIVFVITAVTNDSGMIFCGLLELSTIYATAYYWFLAGASALFVLIGIIILIKGANINREIVVTDSAISSPKNNFSSKIITVNFSSINKLYVKGFIAWKFLEIKHNGGKLLIPNNMLTDNETFAELVNLLEERISKWRSV